MHAKPSIISTALLSTLAILASPIAQASSISASFEGLELPTSYLDESVTLKPQGPAIAASYDINENWSIDASHHSWDDNRNHNDLFNAESDLKSTSIGLSYFDNQWSYSLSYNRSKDDSKLVSIERPNLFNRVDKTEADSYGLSIGYGWMSENWFYNGSFALQSSNWDSRSVITVPTPQPPPNDGGSGNNGGGNNGGGNNDSPPPPPNDQPLSETGVEVNSGDARSASASISAAKFWSIDENRGVLAGAMFSWHHTFSGQSDLVSQTGRMFNRPPSPRRSQQAVATNTSNGSNTNVSGISSLSGDDSYGQITFYVSYDLSENWSIDFDTGFDISTEDNTQVWSVSLGYYF